MILTVKKEYDYIPNFNGNKNLKKEEQVVVTLRLPTAGEAERYQYAEYSGIGNRASMSMRMVRDIDALIENCVLRIKNISLRETDGTNRAITTGRKLLSCNTPAAVALVGELVGVLLEGDNIGEEDAKN